MLKTYHKRTKKKQSKAHQLWTVEEWIKFWYKTYKETKHAHTTRQVQETYIRCHIVPQIGSLFMHQVKPFHIQDMLNFLQREGNQSKLKHATCQGKPLAAWTIKKIRALLLAAFERAVRDGIIVNNPVRNTEPITVQTLHVAYFTPEHQKAFLEGTKKYRFHVAYQLLFYTGCRRSEILGLTWDNIDFIRSQIHIRQVLVNINGVPMFKEYPKTRASVRTIPIHPALTKLLKEHQKNQLAEKKKCPTWDNKYNLVFTNKDGSPHSPTYFLHNFKSAVRKLGLPKNLHVHSTRHTFATNLLQIGTAISDVQHLGGWSDTRVVLEIYAHAVQDSHRSAVEQLFENNQPGQKGQKKKRKK